MKKLLSLILSFLLLASLCPALADTPPADQIAASGESVVEWYNKTRSSGELISYTQAGISAGTGYVIATGKTETNTIVNTVEVALIIQIWENNEWNDYLIKGYQSCDVNKIHITKAYTVESGHYYRLVTAHTAYHGTTSDIRASVTNSVFVN